MNTIKSLEVYAGKAADLKFQIDVEGTPSPTREVRLSVITDSMKISYLGKLKSNVAMFSIIGIENFIRPGQTYDFELEVYIGNQYFAPFTGKIEVVQPFSINVKVVEQEAKVTAAIEEEVKAETEIVAEHNTTDGDADDLKGEIVRRVTERLVSGVRKPKKNVLEIDHFRLSKDIASDVLNGLKDRR